MGSNLNIPVFVHDPIGATWSRLTARFYTSDELRALRAPLKGQPCIVVIDEAAEFFRVGQHENHCRTDASSQGLSRHKV